MTPTTAAGQAPLAMGFSRQEYWSGLPFPSLGNLPNPGIEPASPALAGGFFTTSTIWEALSRVSLPLKPLGEDPSPSLPASSLSLPRCSSAYGSITPRSVSIFMRPSSLRVSCIQISLFLKKFFFIYLAIPGLSCGTCEL